MANLTANITLRTSDSDQVQSFPVVNAQQLYAGALVSVVSTTGLLQNYDGTLAGARIAGILLEDVLGNTGATPVVTGKVDISGRKIIGVLVTGATTAGIGKRVYCADGNALTGLTMTANTAVNGVGYLTRVGATTADCDIVLYKLDKFSV